MENILSTSFIELDSNDLFFINGGDSVDWLGIVLGILGLGIAGFGFLLSIPFAGTIGTMVGIVALLICVFWYE